MSKGDRTRDEHGEIFRVRSLRAMKQTGFPLSEMRAMGRLGAAVNRLLGLPRQGEAMCVWQEGQIRGTTEEATAEVRANSDGGNRNGERWSSSGNILKAEPAARSDVGV